MFHLCVILKIDEIVRMFPFVQSCERKHLQGSFD